MLTIQHRQPIIYPGTESKRNVGVTFEFNDRDIFYMEIVDKTGNNSGGVVKLMNGGIGNKYCYLQLQSSGNGLSIMFQLKVYGVGQPDLGDFIQGNNIEGNQLLYRSTTLFLF